MTYNVFGGTLNPTLLYPARRMAIANERASVSAISLRHNLATSGESRRYDVAFIRFAGGGIWLRQESLRRILASPGYAPGTIAVNVTWMGREFNAGQTHRRMYTSIFNRLRVIARYWSEIATFSYPLEFNAPVGGVVPIDSASGNARLSTRPVLVGNENRSPVNSGR